MYFLDDCMLRIPRLAEQELAAKKAALVEGKARREARTKAAARRSASVVRLMELESKGIRLEKEALVCLAKLLRFYKKK